MVCYDRQYLAEIQLFEIWNLRVQKNLNIEKITFKVVQMKFLAMHITNQKLSFDIFTVGNLQNIFMEHDLNILMIFGIKEKCIILTIQCIVVYCYKYTGVTYDCFCAPGTHICYLSLLNMNLNPNFRPSLISHTRCTSKLEFVENICFEINCETKITRSSYRLPFYKTLSGIKCSDGNELGNTNPAPDTHCVRKALFLHVKVNETGLNASRNSNLRSSWSWKYSDY